MTADEQLDTITLEVVRNALASTADEMALVLMRSAYSPVVRDTMDYSTALCDRHGRLVAQGLTLAVQLGSFPTMMSHLCEEHADTACPGDVFITNDPYGYGGQHLPDIYVVKPIFVDDELEGYAATRPRSSRRAFACRSSSSMTAGSRTRPSSASSRRTPGNRRRCLATSRRRSPHAAPASAASRSSSSGTDATSAPTGSRWAHRWRTLP